MNKDDACIKKKLIKNFNFIDNYYLEECDPPIKEIIECMASLHITERKIVKTCAGYKLIIKGSKLFKVCYSSTDCESKVLLKKIYIPFFESFPLSSCMNIKSILTSLCYCDIDLIDCYSLTIYNIVNVCIFSTSSYVEPTLCDINDCNNSCEQDLYFKNDNCFKSSINIKPNVIYPCSDPHCEKPKDIKPYCNDNIPHSASNLINCHNDLDEDDIPYLDLMKETDCPPDELL